MHDFASEWPAGVDLEMHPSGDLSDVRFGWGSPPSVTRYTYSGSTNSPPRAVARAEPESGPAPLTVEFTGSGSSDPDDDELTFDWDFGDSSPHSDLPDPTHTYAADGPYTARLTVTDSEGNESADTVLVTVTSNQAPSAMIESPADGSLYRDGAPVTLTGSGSDPEEGELAGGSLKWRVLLHHNTHVHTLTTLTGAETKLYAAGRPRLGLVLRDPPHRHRQRDEELVPDDRPPAGDERPRALFVAVRRAARVR